MSTNDTFDPHAAPLYIHGLEGSARGTKGSFMLETFGHSGPDMLLAKRGNQPGRPECFEPCYEVMKTYLEQRPASVLVGSSFGGAITMALLQREVWRGPVVLLAPAIEYYGFDLSLPMHTHAIVIHDPQDELIDFSGSVHLLKANPKQCELWASDGGHKLRTVTKNGLLERAVRIQILRAQED